MSAGGGAGLLELVARGKKDTFFTGEPKISFFHSLYRRASPWLRETRFLLPRNEGDFDSYIDFTLDPVADIIKDIHLVYQNKIDTIREDLLSVLILVLIFIELIVGILTYLK